MILLVNLPSDKVETDICAYGLNLNVTLIPSYDLIVDDIYSNLLIVLSVSAAFQWGQWAVSEGCKYNYDSGRYEMNRMRLNCPPGRSVCRQAGMEKQDCGRMHSTPGIICS